MDCSSASDASERLSASGDDLDNSEDVSSTLGEADSVFGVENDVASVSKDVERLVASQCYRRRCLHSKAKPVRVLVRSLSVMTAAERKVSIFTALALCAVFEDQREDAANESDGSEKEADPATTKERERFQYVLPLIGRTCRAAFLLVYKISHVTLASYRRQVVSGSISAAPHGNRNNNNAGSIDESLLVPWFREFAAECDKVVPVKVCIRKTDAGRQRRFYSSEKHTTLPSYFTWETLLNERLRWAQGHNVRTRPTSLSSFTLILKRRCPYIQTRSPRAQACDQYVIYRTKLRL